MVRLGSSLAVRSSPDAGDDATHFIGRRVPGLKFDGPGQVCQGLVIVTLRRVHPTTICVGSGITGVEFYCSGKVANRPAMVTFSMISMPAISERVGGVRVLTNDEGTAPDPEIRITGSIAISRCVRWRQRRTKPQCKKRHQVSKHLAHPINTRSLVGLCRMAKPRH